MDSNWLSLWLGGVDEVFEDWSHPSDRSIHNSPLFSQYCCTVKLRCDLPRDHRCFSALEPQLLDAESYKIRNTEHGHECHRFSLIPLDTESGSTTGVTKYRLVNNFSEFTIITPTRDGSYKIKSDSFGTMFTAKGFFKTENLPDDMKEDEQWMFPAANVSLKQALLSASFDLSDPVELRNDRPNGLRHALESVIGKGFTGQVWVTRWESKERFSSTLQILEGGSKSYGGREESVLLEHHPA